jgi:DNA adenine methylase
MTSLRSKSVAELRNLAAAAGHSITGLRKAALLALLQPAVPTTNSYHPPLKWVGGKGQILDAVLDQFPTVIHNYYEPFLGGGSVLIGLLSRMKEGRITVTGSISASDLNPTLIGFYKIIQTNPSGLITECERLATDYAAAAAAAPTPVVNRTPATPEEARSSSESFYYWCRAQFNLIPKTPVARATVHAAALFLFLNRTCFRGVYREGPHGFNVPYGHYKNPTIVDPAQLHALSALLQPVVFSVVPVATLLAGIVTPDGNDFMYLDPPYVPETGTSFTAYNVDGFGPAAHTALFEALHGLSPMRFLLSNSAMPIVLEAFPAPTYNTKHLLARRAIHSKAPGSTTTEVLIWNW